MAPDFTLVGTGLYRWPHYPWQTGPVDGGVYANNTPPPQSIARSKRAAHHLGTPKVHERSASDIAMQTRRHVTDEQIACTVAIEVPAGPNCTPRRKLRGSGPS